MRNLLLRTLPRDGSDSLNRRLIVDLLVKYAASAVIIAAGIVVALAYRVGEAVHDAWDVVIIVGVVIVVIIAIRVFEHLWGVRVGPKRDIDQLTNRIQTLEEQMERERRDYVLQISGLRNQVSFLTLQYEESIKKLGRLEAREKELTAENESLRKYVPDLTFKLPSIPLLHICGDEQFCRQDRVQLNRARIPYRALDEATKRDIEDEMQRRREDGTEYPWMLISAHGRKEGVMLADGIASPYWWNQTVDQKTRLVVFANCDGPEVGDALAGIARRVIVMYGDIPTEDASAFILALFRAKLRKQDADAAFLYARQQVPQIAPYVDIRRS